MDLAEEAKSLWPISSVFSAPLQLRCNCHAKLGSLLFHPSPTKFTTITKCSSSTHISSSVSNLSLPRFLQTTEDISILPSTCSAIASSSFIPQTDSNPPPPPNTLQMLRFSRSRVLLFFPTGQNLDQVAFVLLSVQAGKFVVMFTDATKGLHHRILRLVVQKVDDKVDFGYLLVSSMYSIFCYAVRLSTFSDTPKLEYLGAHCFNSAVVNVSWSPHIPDECVVFLQTGILFLFDFEPCCFGNQSSINDFIREKLRISWDDFLDVIDEQGSWLSCEFSWNPRIFVVAHSSAVFLVDLRSQECKVKCLLIISMLAHGSFVQQNDQFVALSRAGPDDGFNYTVASNSLLFLCDVRKPLKPVLQWSHSIDNPDFITVVKLSKLRSNSKNDEYMWASEHGYCILMGSFWDCEFSLFSYGPHTKTCAASAISTFCKSLYAWGLPSDLSLEARDCFCGSCLVREEFSKDALPEWIDWRQKKDRVLGFCILDEDLSFQLFEQENSGGFTLIRLMSSSNLELQRYFASQEVVNSSDKAHKESTIMLKESLIYGTGDKEYIFSEKFHIQNLDYLYGDLNNKLGVVFINKKKGISGNAPEVSSDSEYSHDICKELMACGANKFRSSAGLSDAVRDIVAPLSMMEIAEMSMWSSLPPILLRMGFVVSQKNLSCLQFLDVPHQTQLPPFVFRYPSHCSNNKMKHDNMLVGPAAPLHFLVTYNKLNIEEADRESANRLLELECNKVTQMVNKVVARDSAHENLANDREHADKGKGFQDENRFAINEQVAFSNKISNVNPPTSASSTFQNQHYSTFLSRCGPTKVCSNDKLEPKAIDTIPCSGLKFDDRAIDHLHADFKCFFGLL